MTEFTDRNDAGKRLAGELLKKMGNIDRIIGIAHGGVVISSVLSRMLKVPHSMLKVKKIGSPDNPELAVGAEVPDGQKINVSGSTLLLTDDGAATGATINAAIDWLEAHHAKKIIVALPVAPPEVKQQLHERGIDSIILVTQHDFVAVGQFYNKFEQLTDRDMVKLLQ